MNYSVHMHYTYCIDGKHCALCTVQCTVYTMLPLICLQGVTIRFNFNCAEYECAVRKFRSINLDTT